MAKTKILIDYKKCGDGNGADPRNCCRCLRVCEPAVFLLHQTVGAKQQNPLDPDKWRVTALWPSLCNFCMKCVEECPLRAITVK